MWVCGTLVSWSMAKCNQASQPEPVIFESTGITQHRIIEPAYTKDHYLKFF